MLSLSSLRLSSRKTFRAFSAAAAAPSFETLLVSTPTEKLLADSAVKPEHIAIVSLNRPDKLNAMNRKMWAEIKDCFEYLGSPDHPSRVIILTGGTSKHFTAGLDLMDHAGAFAPRPDVDVGRRAWELKQLISHYQASMSSLEACPKPVIAAMHSGVIGGGVDLVCAADIRIASADAQIQVKEAEIAIVADVGTLQRMPKITGNESWVRELALTARRVTADEALRFGFLSAVLKDQSELQSHALAMAKRIASLSPLAVQGTKLNLNQARDSTVAEGLRYAAAWNMSMLQSSDLMTAATAAATGGKGAKPPVYPDLK